MTTLQQLVVVEALIKKGFKYLSKYKVEEEVLLNRDD